MNVLVTGGAGFIGSNVVKALNAREIVPVIYEPSDTIELYKNDKWKNLSESKWHVLDDPDPSKFRCDLAIHMGAITDTTPDENTAKKMWQYNLSCSTAFMREAAKNGTRLIYASSAAVYGNSLDHNNPKPMNYYGFLKLLADEYLLNMTTKPSQWVGLRFFNVYGPGEQHKGKMASMIYQAYCQFKETGKVKLFKDGTQKRDFIHVDDVVRVIMWMIDHPSVNGIFDVGSGSQMSFIDMAYEVADSMNMKGSVEIKLINMPDSIKDKFQVNTCADLSKLDAVDCYTCTGSIRDYIKWLQDR